MKPDHTALVAAAAAVGFIIGIVVGWMAHEGYNHEDHSNHSDDN